MQIVKKNGDVDDKNQNKRSENYYLATASGKKQNKSSGRVWNAVAPSTVYTWNRSQIMYCGIWLGNPSRDDQ